MSIEIQNRGTNGPKIGRVNVSAKNILKKSVPSICYALLPVSSQYIPESAPASRFFYDKRLSMVIKIIISQGVADIWIYDGGNSLR